MQGAVADLRAAAKALARAPGFVAVALATLAAAIAVNAAMFSFLNGAFIRELPFATPQQLHHVRVNAVGMERFEPPLVTGVRDVLAPFGSIAVYTERGFVVANDTDSKGSTGAEVVQGSAADDRLLDVLGVRPVLGRSFDARDVTPGAPPAVIVSDDFWRSRLAARADAVGSSIRIDGVEHAVIGVMPPRFGFPDFAQFWVPFSSTDARLGDDVQALLRLREGVAVESASRALEAALRDGGHPGRVWMRSLIPEGGALLVAMLGAIGFVLLIACSNVANLVLARGTARRHEMAVRMALGASQGALLRYMTLEGALIALIAGLAGTLGSVWLSDLLVAAIPADQLPNWFEVRLDLTVLAYIAGVALVAVLVSAAMPAVTLTRGALAVTLTQAGGRSVGDATAARLRTALLAVQLALATTLIAGAGLLLRSFAAMRTIDPGYAADAVLELPTLRPAPGRPEDRFPEEAMAQLAALPGVTSAAAIAPHPDRGRVTAAANPEVKLSPRVEAVSASYFTAIGLPILRGRGFREGANEADVAVISELTAGQLFGEARAAVGATFSFENDAAQRRFTVIGVAADRRGRGHRLDDPVTTLAHVYLPLGEGDVNAVRLLARVARGDPLRLAHAATVALRELDPDLVARTPQTRGDLEREPSGDLRWFATVFGGFGAVALALAALGIWSVTAYTVSRRTREIGVRMTLGATPSRVIGEISLRIAPAAGIGLGLGLFGAVGIGYLLRKVLFNVQPADPTTLALTLLAFATVTLLAAWVPARRAAAIDPLRALRIE